jgi:hypothetical protein
VILNRPTPLNQLNSQTPFSSFCISLKLSLNPSRICD